MITGVQKPREKEEDLRIDREVRRKGAHPLWPFGRRELDPIKLAYISQYASSPDNRADCYAELAVSSPAVAETIAGTHCTNPWRDGQAEWPEEYQNDRLANGVHQSQY